MPGTADELSVGSATPGVSELAAERLYMANSRQVLLGSEHQLTAPAHAATRVAADEVITVSVYLHPAESFHAGGVQERSTVRKKREASQEPAIAAVSAFAAEFGLEVTETHAGRRIVKLTGTAAQMEAAFETELYHVGNEGSPYRGRAGSLTLPENVANHVLAVLGLDTTPVASSKLVPHRGTPKPHGFLPTEVAALYGLGDLDASDQCIGIIELGGGYAEEDNAQAFNAMGLSVPNIVPISVDEATNSFTDGTGADGEVALDIQVAGGVARGAKIAVYFAPNTSQGFADAISQAVHDEENKPSVLSISWGGPEDGWSGQAIAAMSAAFQDAAMLGVTITAASGDSLATDGEEDGKLHVDYPASDPLVLGCGGTRLSASGGKRHGETVWKSNGGGTGGGVSALFPKPDYQQDVDVPEATGQTGGRGVPDVAGNADPDSGYRIVAGGRVGLIGGTSAVAPLWAGIVAGLNARRTQPVGSMQAPLYGAHTACHDITRGNNKAGDLGFDATKGWDPCTGLGSPNGVILNKVFGASTDTDDDTSLTPGSPAKANSVGLLKLTGLDGSPLLVAASSIYRIRAAIADGEPAGTKVEYGSGYLFTHESIAGLLARIGSAARFVELTTRSGTSVYLNTAAIGSVQTALPQNAPGTEIEVAGQYQHVMQTVDQVEALLG